MIDPFTAWSRMAAAGFEMQRTWMRGLETAQASRDVVAARSDILRDAAAHPFQADVIEIGRMVPEKVDAFSRSFGSVMRDSFAMQSAWTGQMQKLGLMMLSGKVPSFAEASTLATQTADYALGAFTAGAEMGKGALAPVHRAATGNARRLKRKKGK